MGEAADLDVVDAHRPVHRAVLTAHSIRGGLGGGVVLPVGNEHFLAAVAGVVPGAQVVPGLSPIVGVGHDVPDLLSRHGSHAHFSGGDVSEDGREQVAGYLQLHFLGTKGGLPELAPIGSQERLHHLVDLLILGPDVDTLPEHVEPLHLHAAVDERILEVAVAGDLHDAVQALAGELALALHTEAHPAHVFKRQLQLSQALREQFRLRGVVYHRRWGRGAEDVKESHATSP